MDYEQVHGVLQLCRHWRPRGNHLGDCDRQILSRQMRFNMTQQKRKMMTFKQWLIWRRKWKRAADAAHIFVVITIAACLVWPHREDTKKDLLLCNYCLPNAKLRLVHFEFQKWSCKLVGCCMQGFPRKRLWKLCCRQKSFDMLGRFLAGSCCHLLRKSQIWYQKLRIAHLASPSFDTNQFLELQSMWSTSSRNLQ